MDRDLYDWALARYGSEEIASNPEIALTLLEDVRAVERDGQLPMEDEIRYDDFLGDLNDRLRLAGRPPIVLPAPGSKAV
jgi:hypothetical protein